MCQGRSHSAATLARCGPAPPCLDPTGPDPAAARPCAGRRLPRERKGKALGLATDGLAKGSRLQNVHVATEAQQSVTALFSDKAAADAAAAKADAKKVEAERRMRSIAQGYTGNMCSECQNFTMVRNGTCEKCDTCGATSGCS